MKKYRYLLLIIPIIIFCVKNVVVDNDIWFLLNHGRYVYNNGIPFIEPFTLHEGFSFVMQQWLSSLIFWVINLNFGNIGLFLFVVLIGLIICIFYYKLCNRISNNKYLSIIVTILFSFVIRNYVVSRPQIFTYLLLISELYFLESYVKTNNKRYLYVLPFISLLQINLHASMWFMQFAFLIPFIINGVKFKNFKLSNYYLKPILIVSILMFLVGFINPYGIDAITYVFNSYGVNQINELIAEMKPISYVNSGLNLKILLCCIFVIIFCFNYFKERKIEVRHLCLLFGTLLLVFMNIKSLPYFFMIYFYAISYFFKNTKTKEIIVLNKLNKNRFIKAFNFGLKTGCYFMLIVTLGYTFYYSIINLKYDNAFKQSADVILNDMKKEDIRLYVGYNNGGYMEYRGIKAYIDPRAEVFLKKNNKKEDIFNEYYEMDKKEDFDFTRFIDKYKFTHFLVYPDEKIEAYLINYDDKYKLLYEQYENEDLIGRVYKTIMVE